MLEVDRRICSDAFSAAISLDTVFWRNGVHVVTVTATDRADSIGRRNTSR